MIDIYDAFAPNHLTFAPNHLTHLLHQHPMRTNFNEIHDTAVLPDQRHGTECKSAPSIDAPQVARNVDQPVGRLVPRWFAVVGKRWTAEDSLLGVDGEPWACRQPALRRGGNTEVLARVRHSPHELCLPWIQVPAEITKHIQVHVRELMIYIRRHDVCKLS